MSVKRYSSSIQFTTSHDDEIPGTLSGFDRFRNKRFNKGLGFTREERQLLGIHGLLPHVVKSMSQEIEQCMNIIKALLTPLDQYIYLSRISDYNERLFYNLVRDNITELLPIIYTPTIGIVCQHYHFIQSLSPKGLYITIRDKGHIYDVIKNWPETDIKAVCCTNGGRILGLGDLGANGMGITIGKLTLYTAVAGFKPNQLLPICLDVGTNNNKLLDDINYIGIREQRCLSNIFEEFMDEFMLAITQRFGHKCIIHFEDFDNENAFKFLNRYRNDYCIFNDDIQGTGSVVLAGLYASIRLTNIPLKDHRILFMGAGEAALGTANAIVSAMEKQGLEIEEAREHIWLFDSCGIVCKDRDCKVNENKMPFAHCYKPTLNLLEAVEKLNPTILIGASAVAGAFTKQIIETMSKLNNKPIIFVLSNPTEKSECTAQQAISWSKGKVIFASGSPFPPMECSGQRYEIGQCNNMYIFPGLLLGVMCAGVRYITDDLFLVAADKLSKLVTREHLELGLLYPPLLHAQTIAMAIAEAVMHYAYRQCLATNLPKPKDKIEYIKSKQYNFEYPATFPQVYKC